MEQLAIGSRRMSLTTELSFLDMAPVSGTGHHNLTIIKNIAESPARSLYSVLTETMANSKSGSTKFSIIII